MLFYYKPYSRFFLYGTALWLCVYTLFSCFSMLIKFPSVCCFLAVDTPIGLSFQLSATKLSWTSRYQSTWEYLWCLSQGIVLGHKYNHTWVEQVLLDFFPQYLHLSIPLSTEVEDCYVFRSLLFSVVRILNFAIHTPINGIKWLFFILIAFWMIWIWAFFHILHQFVFFSCEFPFLKML